MKYTYILILILFCMGCKQDDEVIAPLEDLIGQYRHDDAILLEVSSKNVVLDLTKRREQALLVTWENLKDIEAHYPVKYLFKMDITERGFTTSIPTEEIPSGVNFKSFTHEELENLIRSEWGVVGSDNVSISVRVIAQVSSDTKFISPLYSTIELNIRPFNVESRPLFLYGDAVLSEGQIEMTENIAGELYSLRGNFKKGSLFISQLLNQEFPAFGKGEADQVISLEAGTLEKKPFSIEKDGAYSILFDRTNMRINIQEVPYLNIYFGGSATPTLWSTPMALTWDVNRPNIGTITANLVAGEMKFSTETNFSAATMQLRPMKPDASIQTDLDVMATVSKDWKWRTTATESGRYRIVLDIKSMKIQFIKIN